MTMSDQTHPAVARLHDIQRATAIKLHRDRKEAIRALYDRGVDTGGQYLTAQLDLLRRWYSDAIQQTLEWLTQSTVDGAEARQTLAKDVTHQLGKSYRSLGETHKIRNGVGHSVDVAIRDVIEQDLANFRAHILSYKGGPRDHD